MFPERFSNLPAYAFPRLRALLDHHTPGLSAGEDVIHMTIGEPKHAFPEWVSDVLAENVSGFNNYPPNEGAPELLSAAAGWVKRRFDADLDPATQVMALNGTREGLYNAAMTVCPETKNGKQPIILSPNPFYQVYMVAALSVGAEPYFVNANAATGFLPDFAALPEDVLDRTSIAYMCSPSNPQGAVATDTFWRDLITLAEKYDFKIFADECYAEIYRGDAPGSALKVAQDMGADPERVIAFHSLSKRSNMPGLRSGFVASGPETIKRMKQQRAYSGTPIPMPLQKVSERAWSDDEHVEENRQLYLEKFRIADDIFANVQGYKGPEAGFFLWLPVEDGEEATLKLWKETGVRVLPGAYLSKDTDQGNPGKEYIRVAMVAPKDEMQRGLEKIRDCLFA
ncbi:aminotransferase class I/II-fold pyridoxal phosphate-dependent enzyme [Planktotalea sp.]|uniref:aminotransferase class I/II-fold pyridoxal phosphate-dependent enzyme n=1 Tax=Planktotalea sp. TaxID=2029877 RepID=UPI0032998EC6